MTRLCAWALAAWAVIIVSFLAGCQQAKALELGVQDDGRTSAEVLQDVAALNGGWTRTIAYVGQPDIADRIRAAHAAGKRIILTVGGTGTRTRKPARLDIMRYIASLPRADRYTLINEPDLSGMKACTYRRLWMAARRRLGTRLLLGDFSPWSPLGYSAAVRRCGRLPKRLGVAIHPYQPNDPFAPSVVPDWKEGGMGNLGHARRILRGMGVRVTWWLDEFGYPPTQGNVEWLWPRAVRRARQLHAAVLIAYTASGRTWDTKPTPAVWCVMTGGRDCPHGLAPEHRKPVRLPEDHQQTVHQDEEWSTMMEYAG